MEKSIETIINESIKAESFGSSYTDEKLDQMKTKPLIVIAQKASYSALVHLLDLQLKEGIINEKQYDIYRNGIT